MVIKRQANSYSVSCNVKRFTTWSNTVNTIQDILNMGEFVVPSSPIRAIETKHVKLVVNWNEESDKPATDFTVSVADTTFSFSTNAYDATQLGVVKGETDKQFEYQFQTLIITGDFESVDLIPPYEFYRLFKRDGNVLPTMDDLEGLETYVSRYRDIHEMVFGQSPSPEKLIDVLHRWCDLRKIPRDIFNVAPPAPVGGEQA